MKKKAQPTGLVDRLKEETSANINTLIQSSSNIIKDDKISDVQKQEKISDLFQNLLENFKTKLEDASGLRRVIVPGAADDGRPEFWRKNLDYGERETKVAKIRGDNLRACPFGLPIPSACKNAGKAIDRMAPVADKGDEHTLKANKIVYAYYRTCKRCPYANRLLDDFDKVDCNFGDTGQGKRSTPFAGSPLYTQTFTGHGMSGLYGHPLGFYSDSGPSRNMFFGLFSLLGSHSLSNMVKLAYDYCEEDRKEEVEIIDWLLETINSIKDNNQEAFEKVESYIENARNEYEDSRTDPGKMQELIEGWFGSRQTKRF